MRGGGGSQAGRRLAHSIKVIAYVLNARERERERERSPQRCLKDKCQERNMPLLFIQYLLHPNCLGKYSISGSSIYFKVPSPT